MFTGFPYVLLCPECEAGKAGFDTIKSVPFTPADERIMEAYRFEGDKQLVTPALLLYPAVVDANIETTLQMAGGDANRWRPHVKTAKLPFVMKRMMAFGIQAFKCSTTLELRILCELGAEDVLLAFPISGANADRVKQIARQWPGTRISVLVESEAQAAAWSGSSIGMFIDINPGMDRTGISQERTEEVLALVKFVAAPGGFAGLHYYDGHVSGVPAGEREPMAQEGYRRLLTLVRAIENAGTSVPEVVTSGTPAAPYALSYKPFTESNFVHRISPGTVVYNDLNSLQQLSTFNYRPAVLVLSTVVSHPAANVVTCDAGHKAVSVDSGVPNCAVLGWPALQAQKPSEEHLPLQHADSERLSGSLPSIGEPVYLLPKHVCPTVNNFDEAVLVKDGRVQGLERVRMRGHESPLIIEEVERRNATRQASGDVAPDYPDKQASGEDRVAGQAASGGTRRGD